jgi:hypothetical protein
VDIYDTINWASLTNKARDTIVEKRPIREQNITFPRDDNSRYFCMRITPDLCAMEM